MFWRTYFTVYSLLWSVSVISLLTLGGSMYDWLASASGFVIIFGIYIHAFGGQVYSQFVWFIWGAVALLFNLLPNVISSVYLWDTLEPEWRYLFMGFIIFNLPVYWILARYMFQYRQIVEEAPSLQRRKQRPLGE